MILFYYLFSSCDGLRKERVISNGSSEKENQIVVGIWGQNGASNAQNNSAIDIIFNNGAKLQTYQTIPSDLSHCSFANDRNNYALRSDHLDSTNSFSNDPNIDVCQSSSNELDIYIRIKNPIHTEDVCIIPINNNPDDNNRQTFIGSFQCVTLNTTDLYKVALSKNRTSDSNLNYNNLDLNGVIILRDKSYYYAPPYLAQTLITSKNAFLTCQNYLSTEQNSSYCQIFKQANHYILINFE